LLFRTYPRDDAIAAFLLLTCTLDHPRLLSFPTRRSSDLRSRAARWRRSRSRSQYWGSARRPISGSCSRRRGSRRSSSSSPAACRSEEHTSELQSLAYLVCRLLLEKKNSIHTIADLAKHPE